LISVSFQALAWDNTISDLYYFDRGNPVQLFIPNGAPGPTLPYHGPPVLKFYTKGISAEGEDQYDLKAAVTLSATQQRTLLLFIPASSEGAAGPQYRIMPLQDNDRAFTNNAFNFYNLTNTDMAIRVGDDQFVIKPGRNRIIGLTEEVKKNVNVQMASNTDASNWTLVYQSRWAAPKNRRAWVFIYREGEDRPSIRKYYQVAMTPPPPTP